MRSFRRGCAIAAAFGAALITLIAAKPIHAGLIRLDNSSGSLGALLDDLDESALGTAAAGPIVVPGIFADNGSPLSVFVTGLSAGGVLNATSRSLGINAPGRDQTDMFEDARGEWLSIRFDHTVILDQIDFRGFDNGEAFRIGSFQIAYDALDNKSTDVFVFTTPLRLPSTQTIDVLASSGAIGLQSMQLSVAPTPPAPPTTPSSPPAATVPEPSTALALASLLASGLVRRMRRL